MGSTRQPGKAGCPDRAAGHGKGEGSWAWERAGQPGMGKGRQQQPLQADSCHRLQCSNANERTVERWIPV